MANPTAAPMSAAQQAQQASAQNAQNRSLVLSQSLDFLQQVYTGTSYPAVNPVLNVSPRAVGLIKRFIVEVSGTILNSGSTTITQTDFGLCNVISNLIYTDPANNQRHNTNGQHLSLVAHAKRNRPYGATAQYNTDDGNNASMMLNTPPALWPVFVAPPTIASGASGNFRAVFEVPLAYSDSDLRGAVYSNLINATQNLQITLNAAPVTAGTADNTYAIYSGAAGSAGSISSATVTIYQQYLYNLPTNAQGTPILPGIDLNTLYQLQNTNIPGVAANQAFPISYSNFRSYLSTFAIFNSTGLNAGRALGTDITFWQLQAANQSNLWQIDPLLAAQLAREHMKVDLPAGCYYFPSRNQPIRTNQFGNMQLQLTANTAVPASYVMVYWEFMSQLNTAGGAASLSVAG